MSARIPAHLLRIPVAVIFFSLLALESVAQPALGTTSFVTSSTITMSASAPCTAGKSGTSNGYSFTLFSGVNCALNNAFGGGSDGHINLITTPITTGIWQEGRIASSDGSEFKLNNFVFSVLTTPFIGKTITVTGYRNNVFVTGATSVSSTITATGLSTTTTVDVSANAAFNNVDEFRLTPSGSDAQGTLSIQSVTIAAPVIVLPVTFVDISATRSGNAITIKFTTAEENSIAGYDIQSSHDGINFTTQQTLPGKKGSANDYASTINDPATQVWLRVTANELSGAKNFSRIILVRSDGAGDRTINVYPNPAGDILYTYGALNTEYRITDLRGSLMQKGVVTSQSINIATLATGFYILKIDRQTFKFFKK